MKISATPPVFGTVSAKAVKAPPAVAALTTAFVSIPLTDSEKDFMPSPKTTSCSPNVSKSFSPMNQPTTPPVLGTVSASSVNAFPAVAAFSTTLAFNPSTVSANSTMASPNGTSSSANSLMEEPPVIQEAIPLKISAAVINRIASISAVTPSSIEASIAEAPSINGCTFSMKLDKSVPISPNCPVMPVITPPAIPPINWPIATPIASNKSPPSDINHCKPGI